MQRTFWDKCVEFVNETQMLSWFDLKSFQIKSGSLLSEDWKPAGKVALRLPKFVDLILSQTRVELYICDSRPFL